MNDLETKIRDVLREDANRAPFVGAMPDQVRPLVRRRQAATVVAASLAAVVLIVGSVFAVRSLDRGLPPAPPATGSPTATHWSLDLPRGEAPVRATDEWQDPQDVSVPWVDIRRVEYRVESLGLGLLPHWGIELAAQPPHDRAPGQVLSYGLVVDKDADGVADTVVGVDDDPSTPGAFRVWRTDLVTGETRAHVGPSYAFPIQVDPDEPPLDDSVIFSPRMGWGAPEVRLRDVRFYTWSSLTADGELVATDVAPDTGWMTLPPRD